MLELIKIKEVERLLADGRLSQRKIALASGVSRATISAIASGRRPDYEALRLARAIKSERLGPLARCPECGGMVHTPCRLCRVRQLKAERAEVAQAARRRARAAALRRLLKAVVEASGESCAPAAFGNEANSRSTA